MTTLSPLEALKGSFNPFAAREELLTHLVAGTPLTPEDELTMKWHGLYRERDEGKESLMLRVKLASGAISAVQLRAVAGIATRLACPFVYLTTRQSIEFHGVSLAALPAIYPELDAAGLTTRGACGDVVRGIVACPAAGLDTQEFVDTTADAAALMQAFLDDPAYVNLPRKLKIAFCGCADYCVPAATNDVSLIAAQNADGVWGYRLCVGGGLSATPAFAADLGVWVAPERVVEIVSYLAAIFRDYGNRENRSKARLKHLVLSRGVEWLQRELATRLGSPLPTLPSPMKPATPGWDHLGVYPQKGVGLQFIGIPVPVGRLEVKQLQLLAELAATVGAGRLRITHRQNVILPDIPTESVEDVLQQLQAVGLPVQPKNFAGRFVVCTGKEFCQKSFAYTKNVALPLLTELDARLTGTNITLGMSGCPNGCGQHVIADIGFSGAGVKGENGLEERFDVWVGGGPNGAAPQFAQRIQRRLRPEELVETVENLVLRYRWEALEGETFSAYAQRVLWEEAGGQSGS